MSVAELAKLAKWLQKQLYLVVYSSLPTDRVRLG
jgi:hypothetical protein